MKRMTFWLVWAAGVGPLLLAVFMYATGFGVPEGRTHHGELLANGARVQDWGVHDAGGTPWHAGRHWQLMITEPPGCETCASWHRMLPKLKTALGKDRDRLEWHVLSATPQQDGLVSADVSKLGAALWIVDPHGNLVMRYDLDQSPHGVLDDLRRLLKLSHLG